ncbi:hypothetical protein BX600DRAFT_555072 [Xylariales sp. PMI_506]|nr:hypothetical protein BX600DRAFT_555072 [Xylariales sp. PMI_506]
MPKIFITGSADGLGLLSARALAARGHEVYLHARSAQRADDARGACPAAAGCLVADLSSAEETKRLAAELSEKGPWDAIVHNAAIMYSRSSSGGGGRGSRTRSGGGGGGGGGGGQKQESGSSSYGDLFAINTMAPYLLTCLVNPPAKRYVFLSSGMHQGGDASLRGLESCNYSDSKLHNVMLASYFARRYAPLGVSGCSSMDPGWVPTKMGGAGAPDDINLAVDTYVLLAEGKAAAAAAAAQKGDGAEELPSGKYWYQSREHSAKADAFDVRKQERLIARLEELSGVKPLE